MHRYDYVKDVSFNLSHFLEQDSKRLSASLRKPTIYFLFFPFKFDTLSHSLS